MQSPGSTKYLESHENHENRWILMQRRGQDSNLQSSGHEPDELTNSSTPLLPPIFLSRIEAGCG